MQVPSVAVPPFLLLSPGNRCWVKCTELPGVNGCRSELGRAAGNLSGRAGRWRVTVGTSERWPRDNPGWPSSLSGQDHHKEAEDPAAISWCIWDKVLNPHWAVYGVGPVCLCPLSQKLQTYWPLQLLGCAWKGALSTCRFFCLECSPHTLCLANV